MREDLFLLINAVIQKGNQERLGTKPQLFLKKWHQQYICNGLGLPIGPDRDRVEEIGKRLIDISTTFLKNYIEDVGGLWFTLEELRGVRENLLSYLQNGTGANEVKFRITLKKPDVQVVLNYAKAASTRNAVFMEDENHCPVNLPPFRQAIFSGMDLRLRPQGFWSFLISLRYFLSKDGKKPKGRRSILAGSTGSP